MTESKHACMWNGCTNLGKHKYHVDGEVVGHYCNEHVQHAKNFINDKINKMPTAENFLPYVNVPTSSDREVVSSLD